MLCVHLDYVNIFRFSPLSRPFCPCRHAANASIRIKGKDEPVTVHELLGCGSCYAQKKSLVKIFCQGLQAYRNREWEQAIALFQKGLQVGLGWRVCAEHQMTLPGQIEIRHPSNQTNRYFFLTSSFSCKSSMLP